jgi:outer membrane protein assembly factor BamA
MIPQRIAAAAALFLLPALPASAQTPAAPPTVDTVLVVGNEKTEAYVILDEMTLRRGSVVTPELLTYDRGRIYSLGLFTSVDLQFDSVNAPRTLYVLVRERWHIIPHVILGFRDGDPKKLYYGAGFLHNNLRGRNQKLYLSLAFGFDPAFSLSYLDPLFDHDHRLSLGFSLSYARIRSRSVQSPAAGSFDENHYDAFATLSKRFNLEERLGLRFGFSGVTVSEYKEGRTQSPDGRDYFLTLGLQYTLDTRDLNEYASRGAFTDLSITKMGFGEGDVNYGRVGFDIRRYQPTVFDITFVVRGYGSLVYGGQVPLYGRAYLGYAERVRGYFSEVFEGEDVVLGTLEFRIPIIAPRIIQLQGLPIPKEFAVWRIGVGLTAFADAGTTWVRGDDLTYSSIRSGYGAGLDLILPYSLIVRTSYAFNDRGRGEFILDLRKAI